MSSETSIDAHDPVRLPSTSLGPGKPDTAGEQFQPWQLFTLAGLIGATIVVFLSRGETPAGIILLSVTIFTAAALGVGVWRALAPFSGGTDAGTPQVLGGRTRAALEREKTLVLRSIKDVEFDRAMGKVSEKDFAEITTRLRARAAGLMRQLDAGASYRQQIEKEIEQRVGARPVAVASLCKACQIENDADARFCKNCGTALGATA
ncbi:MAG: zinc ribbon domain-containing protein [Acidimicrobiia bacterium]|nr:zinc ribbon domain-containing protein [Acidimicrobiia bacterium]